MGNSKIFTQVFGKNLLAPSSTMVRVYDTGLGRIVKAEDAIGDNAPKAFRLRQLINSRRHDFPLYLCPECKQPLILRKWKDRSGFHFSHEFKSDSCPIKEENRDSRKTIDKEKFKDLNESALHRFLKTMLESSLLVDNDFSNVKKERWWKGEDGSEYRRPDVQATYKAELHVAFEIQLSTTYADNIVDRMDFARRNKGILIWVAHKVDQEQLRTAFMDSLYANNSNIFIFNDEMYNKSLDAQKLHLKCMWLEPCDSKIQYYPMKTSIITFDDLQFNQEKQWAYYFDFSSAQLAVEESQKNAKLEELKKRRELNPWDWNPNASEQEIVEFLGIHYESGNMRPYKIKAVINSVLSAIFGNPHGWNFEHNKQIFHLLYQGYPEVVVCFCFLEKQHFNSLGNDPKVRAKKVKIYADLKSNPTGSRFVPSAAYDNIIAEMFPREFEQWKIFRKETGI